jgi:RNA polymerase sigma factor (TIGR02999 family)
MASSTGDESAAPPDAPPAVPVATLIAGADAGDEAARSQLFTVLYERLHRLARREIHRHGGALTLGSTTLLHEVYLRMGQHDETRFPDEARFLGYAARAMRGVIIDHVRERQAQKRGGHLHITALDTETAESLPWTEDELLPIHDALEELALLDPGLAQIVDLKFFCGLSFAEIATLQKTSERTAQRHWEKARMLLHRALRSAGPA